MSVLSGFYRTSYSINGKRASFYARKAGIPELNSDNRYVEDLGKIAGKFALEIEIKDLIGEIKCLGAIGDICTFNTTKEICEGCRCKKRTKL
jgi:hypothetical protein